jgi:hypothetical protein
MSGGLTNALLKHLEFAASLTKNPRLHDSTTPL